LEGEFEIAGAFAAEALKPDQPRIVGRGAKQRGKGGSSISQPAGCEMLENEIGGQRLLLEGRGAGNLLRAVRGDLIRNTGVGCAGAKECALETRSAETAAVIGSRNA
jgi:hypothetical protein